MANQLIHTGLGDRAVALVINVNSVSGTRRLAIEEHTKAHGLALSRRCQDEMQIAGVKAVHDPAARVVEHNRLFAIALCLLFAVRL